MLTKRFRVAAVAIAVMSVGVFVFAVRVRQDLVTVLADFFSVLRNQFGGEAFLPGALELRPLAHAVIPNWFAAEAAHLAVLISVLGIMCRVSWGGTALERGAALERRRRDTIVLQLCCLWALMAVFHNSYDTIMLLPIMVGLYLLAVQQRTMSKQRDDAVALWLLQLALVLGIPGLWWRLSGRVDLSGYERLGTVISHLDRLLVICAFVYLADRLRVYWAKPLARHAR